MTKNYLMKRIMFLTTRASVSLVEDHLGFIDLYIKCNKRSIEVINKYLVPEIPAGIIVHVMPLKWYENWKTNYKYNGEAYDGLS